MTRYILGIDNGGSVTKAALFDRRGTMQACASGPAVPLLSPGGGITERDMDALWASNVAAIRAVMEQAGITGGDIAAVSATGHGNGLYLVDAEGNPTRNAIISTDERAVRMTADWQADPRFATEVRNRTAQSLWPGQPPALLAWLAEHEPSAIERSRWALLASGFVRMKLTGEASCNVSDASGTSLFDVTRRCYDRELLAFYGLSGLEELLPPVVDSAEQAGRVTGGAAEETGLAEGTPVAGGVFDISASALASGLVEKNHLAIVTGTWSINEYISSHPVVDPDLFMTSIYPTRDAWLITEGSPTSAGVYEWFLNSVVAPAAELGGAATRSRSDVYRAIDDLVFSPALDAASVPSFLPFVYGTSKYPSAHGALTGVDSSMGLGHIIRSIFEGIVFSHMDHVRKLEEFASFADEVTFTGGIANSPSWTQLFADAMQRPLRVVDVQEAGALGTAMAAAVMVGEYDSMEQAATTMAPGHRVVTPDPAMADRYAGRFGTWCDALARETEREEA